MDDIPASATDLNWFEEERVIAFGGFIDPWTPTTMFGCRVTNHPNRRIIDASATVVADGVQTSLHTSARLDQATTEWCAGPIRFRAGPEPRERSFAITDELGLGVAGSVSHARAAGWFRAPATRTVGDPLAGSRGAMDTWGSVDACFAVDGDPVPVGPHSLHRVELGTHDRPELRNADAVAPPLMPPQRFWQRIVAWDPDGDLAVRLEVEQRADGGFRSSHALVKGGPTASRTVGDVVLDVDAVNIDLHAGSRWPSRLRVVLSSDHGPRENHDDLHLDMRTTLTVPMLGLGEHHATWVPGRWHDELAVAIERWSLTDLDPADVRHVHVVQFAHGTLLGRRVVGIVESLMLGPHEPSGLTGFTDGWQP